MIVILPRHLDDRRDLDREVAANWHNQEISPIVEMTKMRYKINDFATTLNDYSLLKLSFFPLYYRISIFFLLN